MVEKHTQEDNIIQFPYEQINNGPSILTGATAEVQSLKDSTLIRDFKNTRTNLHILITKLKYWHNQTLSYYKAAPIAEKVIIAENSPISDVNRAIIEMVASANSTEYLAIYSALNNPVANETLTQATFPHMSKAIAEWANMHTKYSSVFKEILASAPKKA